MKNSLWIVIVVVAFFLGFVVGYSQRHAMKAGVGAGAPTAGGYGAPAGGAGAPAAGGYGAPAGGYGAPSGGKKAPAGGYGAPSGGYGR